MPMMPSGLFHGGGKGREGAVNGDKSVGTIVITMMMDGYLQYLVTADCVVGRYHINTFLNVCQDEDMSCLYHLFDSSFPTCE